jgi:hypothetical protein
MNRDGKCSDEELSDLSPRGRFQFFMVLRICQARTEIASHTSPAMARMAGLE